MNDERDATGALKRDYRYDATGYPRTNLQAIAAMDDPEHATGKPLIDHVKGTRGKVMVAHPKTAKEIIVSQLKCILSSEVENDWTPEHVASIADDILRDLRDGGYDVREVVSYG